MSNFRTLRVLLFVLLGAAAVSGNLQLGKQKCGEKRCRPDEYCSKADDFCKSCAIICDNTSHNYDEKECESNCQNYLHDQRYVLKNGDSDLKAVVQRLHTLVSVTLVLICFVLVIITLYAGVQVYKWKKRKNVTLDTLWSKIFSKKSDNNANVPAATPVNGKPSELRLEIPTPGTQSEHSPVTVTTTISSRRPAEDTVPDYAYDNPAMTSTPPNTNKGPHAHESSF